MNNFLVPIQVRLSPNFVSYTLDHRGQGDQISGGQRSRSVWDIIRSIECLLVHSVLVYLVQPGVMPETSAD